MSDPPELTNLIDEHYRFVYGFLYRLSGTSADAEDLTQQTFLSAMANVDQLRDPAKTRSWLCTIGRNAFLKSVRGRRIGSVDLSAVPEPAEATTGDTEIDVERIQQLLGELPEEYRSALVLYYYEDCSYREIAERTDAPIGTVMSRLARGKAWLRRRLGAVKSKLASGRSE